jgi:branched-chain amino acid transport system ATP-binding protein
MKLSICTDVMGDLSARRLTGRPSTRVASLIVDRNYRLVLAHTDRCAVLEKGRIVYTGSSPLLARRPARLTQFLGV